MADRTHRHLGRRSAIVTAGALLAAPAIVRAQGTNGVALVIGNSKYQWEASLPNVKRDVADIAHAFEAMGLRTELLHDANQATMREAVDRFAASARGADTAAFYFAGHGASWDKDTYLVPADADIANPSSVQSLMRVSLVSAAMKGASRRLLMFDNCRNNPADGWRQKAAIALAGIQAVDNVAAMLKEPNTLVLYSTASGRVALDGPPGENSPFAAALLRQFAAPSVDLQALPEKLRRDLLLATQCRQLVWDQNTYRAPFVLTRTGKPVAAGAAPAQDPSRVVELPNAYAFARESKLILPAGLIAWRAPAGSPHAAKIGSFKYTYLASVGTGSSLERGIVVVLAIADNAATDIIYATRSWGAMKGVNWRYVSAKLSGKEMTWENLSGLTGSTEFRWKDNDAGIYSAPFANSTMHGYDNKPFSRLDG